MVTAKSSLNHGVRRGRACSMSTGNPVEDMAMLAKMQSQGKVAVAITPNRPSKLTAAQPIAIPDSGAGPRRRQGSPRNVQSGSPRSHSHSSSKSSPSRASPSSNGLFYAGAKFSEAPSAACLPKPPASWTNSGSTCQVEKFQERLNNLIKV